MNDGTTIFAISSVLGISKDQKKPSCGMLFCPKCATEKGVLLKNLLQKLAKWLCRQLTSGEFASIVPLFLEILSSSKTGFEFKPEPETENYRKFRVDVTPPLPAPPPRPPISPQAGWHELKAELERRSSKPVKAVRRRGGFEVPARCLCEHCNASADFLYLNDGKKGNQVRCKICDHLGTNERIRNKTDAKYFCPHCGSALSVWKQNSHETIYKCFNYNCPHSLTKEGITLGS